MKFTASNNSPINKTLKRDYNIYIYLGLYFILAFSYFNLVAGYVLQFQEHQSLFLYSGSFIHDYLVKPGGVLNLAGDFLAQFYINKFAGSIILAFILTLPGYVLFRTGKRLTEDRVASFIPALIPPLLMLLMQTHYYNLMVYNLGFLVVLVYFCGVTSVNYKKGKYLLLSLFPVFYYIAGAYAFIFLGLFTVYSLVFEKGKRKYLLPGLLIILAFISFILSRELLFLQPDSQLLRSPLPNVNDKTHKLLLAILTFSVVFYPLILKLTLRKKSAKSPNRTIENLIGILFFSGTIFFLIARFNTQTARVINLEELAFREKWKELISYQEAHPSENLIGQYFYNIALSETDQLCDRLFYGRQDFGTASLMLDWTSDHLNWGSYSYYTTGLINEARRWAYEEMVVYGIRPQNMKMLVKTSLLNGNYRLTREYTGIMEKTLFYRNWARKYEKMTYDTSLIRSDNELRSKIKILPKDNFFIYLESPENNLPSLVDGDPHNKRAFEYMMSWLMLSKNVEILVNNIRLMKNMGYTRIPRHIEEAILIYYNSTGKYPDMDGLTISNEARLRFGQYFTAFVAARQNPSSLKQKMETEFGNTFWFYYHFK
jgi:hypothetical protein